MSFLSNEKKHLVWHAYYMTDKADGYTQQFMICPSTGGKENARLKFAARLNKALDNIGYPSISSKRGVTLARALIRMGHELSPVASHKWLTGESAPSLEKLGDLAEIAQTSVDYLVSGKGPTHVSPMLLDLLGTLSGLTDEQLKAVLEVSRTFANQNLKKNW